MEILMFAVLVYVLACVLHLPLMQWQSKRWCFMCRLMKLNNGDTNDD